MIIATTKTVTKCKTIDFESTIFLILAIRHVHCSSCMSINHVPAIHYESTIVPPPPTGLLISQAVIIGTHYISPVENDTVLPPKQMTSQLFHCGDR